MADQPLLLNSIGTRTSALTSAGGARPRLSSTASGLGARLLRGVAWNVFGNAVAQGASLVTAVVLARILGKQAYGEFAFIHSTLLALTTVASLALGVTATKYVSEYRKSHPERAGQLLGLCSVVVLIAASFFSLALLTWGPALLPETGASKSMAWGIRAGAVYVFLITINGYQIGALVGLEAFRAIAVISATSGLLTFGMSWAFALAAGLRGAVMAQVVGSLLLWAMYRRAVLRECRAHGIVVRCRGAWEERSVLWRFSVPAAACGIVISVTMWLCNSQLVRSRDYAELGVFTAAYSIRSMVLFLPALVSRVTTPILNGLMAEGDMSSFRATFWGAVAVNGGIALGLALILGCASSTILRFFGRDFSGSSLLAVFLLGSAVMEVIASTLFQALFASGRVWRNAAMFGVWAILLFGGAILTTRKYGAPGLAFSYLAAWCVLAAMQAWAAAAQSGKECHA